MASDVVPAASPAGAAPQAVVLQIDGAIGPAVADYVVRELRGVRQGETRLFVLRMNTPGGLDTSMREIVRAILSSPVPVATYVAPSGARAASAGTYIAYASAIAAMAPGTNLGAATPIRLGAPGLPGGAPQQPAGQKEKGSEGATSSSEPADAETRKAVNDAVAYIRGLAELNGRNADWAAEAVRTAVSLPASEALKLHVIDVIADDVPDLLRQIDGRVVKVAGSEGGPSERDRRVFLAAAETHRMTGAPILTHCEGGTGALEQVELLTALGVDPSQMTLSHVDKVVDRAYHRELLAAGVNLEYDQSFRSTEEPNPTAVLIAAMIDDGYGDRIVLGMDAARRGYY